MTEETHSGWYLEGFVGNEKRLRRLPLDVSPFRVGRQPGLELAISSEAVSSLHAEFRLAGDVIELADLGSTNGTFLNRSQVRQPAILTPGDVIHFAQFEFLVGRRSATTDATLFAKTMRVDLELPNDRVAQSLQFARLLQEGAVAPLFQPVVSLTDDTTLGHELLGRGNLEGLPTQIGELFEIASYSDQEVDLARAFRSRACAEAYLRVPNRGLLFVNTHPQEIADPNLAAAFRAFQEFVPGVDLVVEIHERAATDSQTIRRLQKELALSGVKIAYDDFGAGQSRLTELTEAPPSFLKFDRELIRDLDRANDSRRRLLANFIELAARLRIQTIAEGVERASEAEACRALGVDLAQGYYFGPPVPPPTAVAANHLTLPSPE